MWVLKPRPVGGGSLLKYPLRVNEIFGAVLTPTPEPCKVQGSALHPAWCRASSSPLKGGEEKRDKGRR